MTTPHLIGACLIASPFVVLTVYSLITDGVRETLIWLATCAVIIGVCAAGCYLLNHP